MPHIFKHIAYLLVLFVTLSCSRPTHFRSAEGAVWNTTYHITYQSETELDDSIRSVMKQVEMSLSPFNANSLISRINKGEEAVADTLLRRIFFASQEVNRNSLGAFDPTVAPLINLWGFGYKKTGIEPTQATIDSIKALVGISECALLPSGEIRKKNQATEFNFSAITKGYGCDLIGEMFKRNGCENFMVEIGGEIALNGTNPRNKNWRIMIDAPIDNDTAVVHERMAVIEPGNGGVATSGNYRNYRQTAEGKVWHTISPTTGRPAQTDLLSATVIAPNAMLADAYATSCMAMTCGEAMDMLSKINGVEALLVTADTIAATPGFPPIMR
ncbi:FAD:protein FMN transferase [uncultured Muribaculum sp.]|mgnify:CR=1 FL=1|uniref:FAD:protein FMN transferase n=1 Tax=uncultured Muribaculum sp. TaxID=1918613 RepID=UPI00263BD505|nr:FAD:protein FMN transferase [uncultured Muribaculum sp.]